MDYKSWLKDNLSDASRSAPITVAGRLLTPIQGFNMAGMVAMIYRDPQNGEYFANITGKQLGFFDSTLSWDDLLTAISNAYAAEA